MSEEEKQLFINKKIKDIYVDSYCIELIMEDNTKLEYDATDGGYSSFEITRGIIMSEKELKVINKFIKKCNKYDESVEVKGISVGEEFRMLNTVVKALNIISNLQAEITALNMTHKYDTDMIEEVKGEAVNLYNKIEKLQKELDKKDKVIDLMSEDIL